MRPAPNRRQRRRPITSRGRKDFKIDDRLSAQTTPLSLKRTNAVARLPVLRNTGAEGGLGQWVLGTFTADPVTQSITFAGDGDYGAVNGFQLRRISQQPTGVPDSGSTLHYLPLRLRGSHCSGAFSITVR
jgi:hypothetical protein